MLHPTTRLGEKYEHFKAWSFEIIEKFPDVWMITFSEKVHTIFIDPASDTCVETIAHLLRADVAFSIVSSKRNSFRCERCSMDIDRHILCERIVHGLSNQGRARDIVATCGFAPGEIWHGLNLAFEKYRARLVRAGMVVNIGNGNHCGIEYLKHVMKHDDIHFIFTYLEVANDEQQYAEMARALIAVGFTGSSLIKYVKLNYTEEETPVVARLAGHMKMFPRLAYFTRSLFFSKKVAPSLVVPTIKLFTDAFENGSNLDMETNGVEVDTFLTQFGSAARIFKNTLLCHALGRN